jgi:HK97 gp10 family phage protein
MEQLSAALQGISNAMRTELLVPAVKKVGEAIEARARQLAPSDSGALKASMATKVVRNPEAGTAAAITGPSRGRYFGGIMVRGRKVRGGNQPSRYAHLIEYGHLAAVKGQKKKQRAGFIGPLRFVAPKPFLRPAVQEIAPNAAQMMADEIGAGIADAARRYAK